MQKFKHDGKTPRCQRSVWRGGWEGTGQCESRAQPDGFCKTHAPGAQEKRDRVARAKHEVTWAKRRKEIGGAKFYAALEEIAAGHNDPRALAQKIIDDFTSR